MQIASNFLPVTFLTCLQQSSYAKVYTTKSYVSRVLIQMPFYTCPPSPPLQSSNASDCLFKCRVVIWLSFFLFLINFSGRLFGWSVILSWLRVSNHLDFLSLELDLMFPFPMNFSCFSRVHTASHPFQISGPKWFILTPRTRKHCCTSPFSGLPST